MQFTVEEESDGRLAFLDVQLSRTDDGTVCTLVYHKATHTNQYLASESHHPIAHKVAVVKTLMSGAGALSSSGVERAQEEKEVTGALKENGTRPALSTSTLAPADQGQTVRSRDLKPL